MLLQLINDRYWYSNAPFYTEWHNEEWVLPPKDFFVKMHAVIDRWRNEEISQREMDLLHCKIIVEELARKRKSQKPNRSGRRTSRELRNFNSMDGSRPHHSSGDSSRYILNLFNFTKFPIN